MSPVGHSIIGLSVAAIALPQAKSKSFSSRLSILCIFVALANLPDWPVPHWGHDRYDISHSVFVNLALVTTAIVCWRVFDGMRTRFAMGAVCLGASACLSHLLLDTFYQTGKGLAMFWPFSDAKLHIPIHGFHRVHLYEPIWSEDNLSVFWNETQAFSPVLVTALIMCWWLERRTQNAKDQMDSIESIRD